MLPRTAIAILVVIQNVYIPGTSSAPGEFLCACSRHLNTLSCHAGACGRPQRSLTRVGRPVGLESRCAPEDAVLLGGDAPHTRRWACKAGREKRLRRSRPATDPAAPLENSDHPTLGARTSSKAHILCGDLDVRFGPRPAMEHCT